MKSRNQKSEFGFFDDVYDVVRKIPSGRVTSYGAIARFIGSGQSARMVGWALNGSAVQEDYVPAHRVVNRTGVLSGKRYFGTGNEMKELLESEGIKIEEDTVVDFDLVFWDPSELLKE